MDTTIWAVGGGKGGTGKTFVSSSLGLHLAALGRKTLLLDADLGAPNLHTFLGVSDGRRDLSDFLMNSTPSLEETAETTPFNGLRLIRGAAELPFAANLNHFKKLKLLRQIRRLQAETVILDIGTGSSFNSLDFFLSAKAGVLVITPEPTAIENGYHFLRSCLLRVLKLYLEYYKIRDILGRLMEQVEKNSHSLYAFFQDLAEKDPQAGPLLARALKNFQPGLVVNKVRTEKDRLLGRSIADVARKYLMLEIRDLGSVPYDERVHLCLKRMRPFVAEHPDSEAALSLKGIAEGILTSMEQSGPPRQDDAESE